MVEKLLKIVLLQPEIPHNTGSAIRLCAGMSAELHLIQPLGFDLDDKHLERVALGYHEVLRPILHKNLNDFLSTLASNEELYFFSSKAGQRIDVLRAGPRVALLFGSETRGFAAIPPLQFLRLQERSTGLKIPQAANFRCHNLSNSIAIGAYEVLRQWEFPLLG